MAVRLRLSPGLPFRCRVIPYKPEYCSGQSGVKHWEHACCVLSKETRMSRVRLFLGLTRATGAGFTGGREAAAVMYC